MFLWQALLTQHHFGSLFDCIYRARKWHIFSTIKAAIKSAILALLDHKDCILSCQWEKYVILSFAYSVLYCFLFGWEKQTFINCSVSGNRKPGNSSWIYMRFWLGCQMWFNSRDGPTMSRRDEMKPPLIKVMQILFTVALLSWNSPMFIPLFEKTVWELHVCLSVRVAGLHQHWRVIWKMCPADKWHVGCRSSKRHHVLKCSQAKISTPTSFH